MTTLLRIDSSSRTLGSRSRELGDSFEAEWLASRPTTRVVHRDLAADPVPHIADQTIAGYYAAPEEMTGELRAATALSDNLIAELKSADVLLITVPMYNFSIPSALKAWIDHIVRINHTFSYDGRAFTGLVTGKHAYIACAYGAAGYDGGPLSAYNLLQPYLQLLLNFLGFSDVTFIGVEATTADNNVVRANLDAACRQVKQTIAVAS
ncbi:MAG: NAD(P)H-dependent oxidoreductase [Hyphomicrobiales bacterium]|nr:NAD(P)H-dependent oxidoreductase [Hyphomicrobiales bacterium]